MLGGGAMTDRRGPARVMIGADLLRFALMACAAVATVVTRPSVPVLVVVAAALAFIGSFFVPAAGALRPQLLPPEHLVRGNALYLIGLRGGQAAGGPVGAWLLGLGGIAAVAVMNAVSFLASAAAVATCAPMAKRVAPRAAEPPLATRIAEGLRYVSRSRELATLMVVIGLIELATSGPVNVGLILVSHSIGAGASGAGLLLTGFTLGATAAFLLSLAFPVGRRAGLHGVLAILGQSAGLVALGWSRPLWLVVVEYAVLGATGAQASLVVTSLLQRRTQRELRGRVMSITALLSYGSVPLGSLTIGAMIEWLGRGTTMALQGSLSVLAAVAFCAAPELRGARLD